MPVDRREAGDDGLVSVKVFIARKEGESERNDGGGGPLEAFAVDIDPYYFSDWATRPHFGNDGASTRPKDARESRPSPFPSPLADTFDRQGRQPAPAAPYPTLLASAGSSSSPCSPRRPANNNNNSNSNNHVYPPVSAPLMTAQYTLSGEEGQMAEVVYEGGEAGGEERGRRKRSAGGRKGRQVGIAYAYTP